MNPEIRRYLDEHGATYGPDALRRQLFEAGYDPVQVDDALREWQAETAGSRPDAAERRTFGRWALGLHLGALVATFALLLLLKGTSAVGIALLSAAFLGVALLIGWAISGLIGRALLRRSLGIALIFPAISAVALGGSCFALMNASIQPPPLLGTAHLEILAPRAFDGTGPATCSLDAGNAVIAMDARELGTLEGMSVTVSLYWIDGGGGAPSIPDENLSIYLNASTPESSEAYSTIFSTRLEADVAASRRSGTLAFEGLSAEPNGAPGAPGGDPISGSVRWSCE